jgi:hypothetical protein
MASTSSPKVKLTRSQLAQQFLDLERPLVKLISDCKAVPESSPKESKEGLIKFCEQHLDLMLDFLKTLDKFERPFFELLVQVHSSAVFELVLDFTR